MSKKVSLLSKGVKMFEVWKLSNQSVVCYTITIVINVSFLLSIHHYRSVNITIDLFSLGGLFPISDRVMIPLRILAFKFSNRHMYMNKQFLDG